MSESQELGAAVLRAVIMLVIAVTCAHSACRGGSDWIEYGGQCYYWQRDTWNWFRSELACKSMGGGLVSIRNQTENSFVLKLTQCSSAFWIGLVNFLPVQRWFYGGYLWWDSRDHPSYHTLNLTNAPYTDCVFSDSKGKWFNTYCQNYLTSVCKAPAVQASSGEHQTELESAEMPEGAHQNATDEWVTSFTADGPTPSPIPRATGSPSRCPEGWLQLDNNCYFHSRNRTNYFNAQINLLRLQELSECVDRDSVSTAGIPLPEPGDPDNKGKCRINSRHWNPSAMSMAVNRIQCLHSSLTKAP